MTVQHETTALRDEIDSLFQAATRMAVSYLEGHEDIGTPVVRFLAPDDLQRKLSLSLPSEGRPLEGLVEDMGQVLDYSVRTGHRRFFNQLFGGHDAAAILGEWVTALINTSMYTYEAAPVATLIEKTLIEKLTGLVGYERGEGIFAPGGSISNLMAFLAARHARFPHIKKEGLRSDDRPVMFLSDEAHYSLRRAASVSGLGLDAAIDIATDELGRMVPDELERAICAAEEDGRQPFLVAATAGTTVPGAFDPIDDIADVASRHGLWLHVDGSYGGSVLLSQKHRGLVAGIERADSVAWNPHKMMGVPLACAAVLMREPGRLAATNGLNADYLFHGDGDSPWNLGDMSLQCGRRVDALKLWFAWQATGDDGFEARIDHMFELASSLAGRVGARDGFSLVREPQGTNICFRYLPQWARGRGAEERDKAEHETTLFVRERLMQTGSFLVNFATLDDLATFRYVANNPRTTVEDLESMLDAIARHGDAAAAHIG